jgi:hypothetical protein
MEGAHSCNRTNRHGYSQMKLARIIHQELADVVYLFEISYDFAVEFQNPRIQRPHPP